jgi:hypothetical protein
MSPAKPFSLLLCLVPFKRAPVSLPLAILSFNFGLEKL